MYGRRVPYRPISAQIGPYRPISSNISPYRSISAHIGSYRPISGHIGPYRAISAHIAPYRGISAHIGPYWSLSAYIGTLIFHCFFAHSLIADKSKQDEHRSTRMPTGERSVGREANPVKLPRIRRRHHNPSRKCTFANPKSSD